MNLHALKHILIIFFILIEIKCQVTERLKSLDLDEVTTKFTVENKTKNDIKKSEKNYTVVAVNEERRLYFDDVLFNLKSQVWDAEEQPCLDDINRSVNNLHNFTLWAVWDWDSMSSEPQGLLFGNKYQLGNFDQCLNAPWFKTHAELRTKYCLATITLERTDKSVRPRIEKPLNPYQSALDYIEYRPPYFRANNELVWGACVPTSCAPRTVERLLGIMLARSHLGAAGMHTNISITEPCQDSSNQREYDAKFYGFIGLAVMTILISLICTYLNCRKKELTPDTIRTDFIKAFCLRENATDLLKMQESIKVFYGIRFLSICLIILAHTIGITNAGPISDGLSFDQTVQSPLGMLIIHDDLIVDTYFLMSGFLTITTLAKFKRLPNPVYIMLNRYIRLVVALAVVLFFITAVFPYTGSGPLWNNAVAQETGSCGENWWLNLLMLNNYVNTENMCVVAFWYIPCEFHCFSVTILIYCLHKIHPRLGKLFAAVVTAGSILIPAIINYVYQLPPVQLFTYEFLVNPRSSKEFQMTYIKSHARYAAYLVGAFSGCLFVRYSADGNLKRIKQKWSIIGTLAAFAIMLGAMLYGSTFLWRSSYHPLEGAVYAALNRPVWAAGVGLLVLCCSLGHVPVVKTLLSWYPWVPLSRLAYGMYLTHFLIITRNVFVARNPQHNNYFGILTTAAGGIFWACVGALLLWLLAEAPVNKLLTLCFKSRIKKYVPQKKTLPTIASMSPSMSTTTVLGDSKGHLNDNLSHNIQYTCRV